MPLTNHRQLALRTDPHKNYIRLIDDEWRYHEGENGLPLQSNSNKPIKWVFKIDDGRRGKFKKYYIKHHFERHIF